MSKHEKPIGIAELINRVKAELLDRTQTESRLFFIEEVELEIAFTVDRTAKGGISIQVLQSGVEGTWGEAQRVRVKLQSLASRERAIAALTENEDAIAQQALVRSVDVDE